MCKTCLLNLLIQAINKVHFKMNKIQDIVLLTKQRTVNCFLQTDGIIL